MRRLSIRARLLLAVGVVVLVNVLATAVVISVTSDQLLDQIDERLLAAAEDSSGVDGPASGVVTVGDVYSGVLTPDGQLVTLHAVRNRGQLFPPPEVDDVRIGVTAKADADHWQITLSNPCASDAQSERQGNGMALDNIRERLAHFYNGQAEMIVEQSDTLFTITVRAPLADRGRPD